MHDSKLSFTGRKLACVPLKMRKVCGCAEHVLSHFVFRAFVMAYKAHYRVDPACPICDDLLDSPPGSQPVEEPAAKQAAASGDDGEDELFATEESGVLFGMLSNKDPLASPFSLLVGKKRKRDKQMYSCYVHIIQATGLQKQKSDKHINPVRSGFVCILLGVTGRSTGGCHFLLWRDPQVQGRRRRQDLQLRVGSDVQLPEAHGRPCGPENFAQPDILYPLLPRRTSTSSPRRQSRFESTTRERFGTKSLASSACRHNRYSACLSRPLIIWLAGQ